jgi:hypothetical protein
MRICIEPECGALYPMHTAPGLRCPACQTARAADEKARKRAYEKIRPPRGSSTQRGYGAAYRKARARLLATARACHWCGAPFTKTSPPTADHDPPLAHGGTERRMVASCSTCNSRRGGQTRRRTA